MTIYGVQGSADVLNLTKYVTGAAINQNGESSGVVSGTALFAGIQGGAWAWKNRSNFRAGLQALRAETTANRAIMQSAATNGTGIWNGIKNFWQGGGEIVSKAKLEALAKGTGQSAQAAQAALATGKNFAEGLKAVEGGGGFLKTLGKGIKGNAWFAAISFGLGVVTDVIPAFQLGTDKGFKQLGKTALKTTAEVGGWAAGSAVGAKLGAAVGTCIGGPVGTAIGGIIGAACGFLGSFLCSKAADKILGPSEVEKAQQEQAEQMSKQAIQQGDGSVSEVAQAAYEQLLQNAAANGGKLSEDDLAAKKSLENLTGQTIDIESELALATQTSASGQTAQAQASQASSSQSSAVQSTVSQTSTQTQNDLPGTSASLYGMPAYNPSAMSAFPYTSYTGTANPFSATSNPFTSYTGLYDYGQEQRRQTA